MTDRELALRVAALRVLRERVKAAEAEVRARLLAELETGDRITASYAGKVLGAVTKARGRFTPRVSDPDRFAAWVAQHYPTEVQHKPVVRPAFQHVVFEASKKAGEPCAPDGTLDVPGIEVGEGEPYLSVPLTDEAEQLVARMIADGNLTAAGELIEIEAAADG